MGDREEAYRLNEEAAALCLRGRFEEGLEKIVKATSLDPKNTNAWHTRGSCLYELGRHAEALEAYVEVLRLDSKDTNTKIVAIMMEAQTGVKNPDLNPLLDASECNAIGLQLFESYRKGIKEAADQALIFYDKATELDPAYSTAWTNKGVLHMEKFEQEKDMNSPPKAVPCFQKAIALDPADEEAKACLETLTAMGLVR